MKKKKINSRTKGQTAERKLVKLFSQWWGSEFFRTPGSGAFATRGFVGLDVSAMAGDLVTPDSTFPFCVESKKVEGWTLEQLLSSDKTLIHKWWDQTITECPSNKAPLLVFTKNRAPLYACMYEVDLKLTGFNPTRTLIVKLYRKPVAIFLLSELLNSDPSLWKATV